MKYAHLKEQRDDAIRRAVEAERLSRKTEVDRLQAALADAEEDAKREGVLAARLAAELMWLRERVTQFCAEVSG